MDQEYQVAYLPIPKAFIKEEPQLEQDQEEEYDQLGKELMAYPPLPHGFIKEELQSGDDGTQVQ